MATQTSATTELEKKEYEEGIAEKIVSLNEEKHDKSEDSQGPMIPLAKTQAAEGEDTKVGVEKTNDSLATAAVASGEGNLKTEEDNKADAALAQEQKNDDSLWLGAGASVAENHKDEKELISESPAISVTETASDAPETPPQETPPTAGEQKQPQTPYSSVEINPQIESEAEAVKETQNSQVQEKSQEPEKESQQKGHEEEPYIDATPKSSDETIEKTTREPESNAIAEAVKETANYGAWPTETEEKPSETEKQSENEEQLRTVIPATSAESTVKPGDKVEVQPPKESDIGIMGKTSSLEVVPVSTDEEKKPKENLLLVGEYAEIEGTSDDIKDPTLISKEDEEKSVTEQISLDKKAQAANEAEFSPGIAENVVEEDGKKESSCKDVMEGVSKESIGVLENPERVFVNEEAKTDLDEEKEDSATPSAEKKLAAIDDKMERDAHDVVEELSREADTAITEEEQAKLENGKDDHPADVNEKDHAETKVDEITPAVGEPVRATLASKLEEKEEESITTVKTGVQKPDPPAKETPAKLPQKQSNNILSKVKQSLVKAKKAITGKSPSTKTISSETKGDILVK